MFRSNLTVKQLSKRLEIVEGLAGNIRNAAQGLFDNSSGNIPARSINLTSNNIALQKEAMASQIGPELIQYAKDQRNDQTYDIVIEYINMVTVIDAFLNWIDANALNSGPWSQVETTQGGKIVGRVLNTGATIELRTELQKILDVIDG